MKSKLVFLVLFIFTSQALASVPNWVFKAPQDQWVNSVSISANGTRGSAGSYKPNIEANFKYWLFAKTGEVLFEEEFPNYRNGIFWVSLSEDGRFGFLGGTRKQVNSGQSADLGFVKVYDHNEGHKVIFESEALGRINMIEQSADSKVAAYISKELVILKQTQENSAITYKQIYHGPPGEVLRYLRVSRDGRRVVTADAKGFVSVYTIEANAVRKILSWKFRSEDPKSTIQSLALSADSKFFAVSVSEGKAVVFRWSEYLQNFELQWEVPSKSTKVGYGLALNEDGSMLAYGTSGSSPPSPEQKNLLSLYRNVCDLEKCHPESYWDLPVDAAPNPGTQFDASGKRLVLATGYPVGKPGSFYLLNVPNKKVELEHQMPDMNWPAAISRDGSSIIGGSDSGDIVFFSEMRNHSLHP